MLDRSVTAASLYRRRLGRGYDPVAGSRILAARLWLSVPVRKAA